MAELLQQLNRAAAQVNTTHARATVYQSPTIGVEAPGAAGESNPSMFFAVGIILGCVLCGALLLMLTTGSSQNPATQNRPTFQPAAASVASNSDEKAASQRSPGSNRTFAARSQTRKNRSSRGRRPDAPRVGGAFIVTEPGKTPKMFESQ
jgi:hypothetical protein